MIYLFILYLKSISTINLHSFSKELKGIFDQLYYVSMQKGEKHVWLMVKVRAMKSLFLSLYLSYLRLLKIRPSKNQAPNSCFRRISDMSFISLDTKRYSSHNIQITSLSKFIFISSYKFILKIGNSRCVCAEDLLYSDLLN